MTVEDLPVWFKTAATTGLLSLVIVCGGALVVLYAQVKTNTDRLFRIELRIDQIDTAGTRALEATKIDLRDMKEADARRQHEFDKLDDRLNNMHAYIVSLPIRPAGDGNKMEPRR
jgi:hypothetical protein